MASWNIGKKNGMWRGGRSVASNGYVLIRVGTRHHLADVRGYAYEHRLVAEQKICRRLRKREHVHHIDGIKSNNRPSNIEVLSSAEHGLKHRRVGSNRRLSGSKNPMVQCACGCDTKFRRFDTQGRPRIYVSGHNLRTGTVVVT